MGAAGQGRRQVRNIVCDTGPVLHLSEAGLLELLRLPGEAHIPDAVHAELIELLQPSWEHQRPPWLSVDALYLRSSSDESHVP